MRDMWCLGTRSRARNNVDAVQF